MKLVGMPAQSVLGGMELILIPGTTDGFMISVIALDATMPTAAQGALDNIVTIIHHLFVEKSRHR